MAAVETSPEHGASQLIPAQRQQIILEQLRASGVATIKTLVAQFGVSHMTIRRDIAALEQAGQVIQVPGGVQLASLPVRTPPRQREERAKLEMPRKQSIAKLADGLIRDNMTIIADAGTTCQALAPYLGQRRNVTVITNDFYTAEGLFAYPGVHIIHTGGEVDPESYSTMGLLATTILNTVNADVYFMSTGAWSVDCGVTTTSVDKVEFKKAAMRCADATFLLADSTKYGVRETYRVVGLDELDGIITDEELTREARQRIEENMGVDLRLAPLD